MELITVNSKIDNQIISEDDITISKGSFIENNTEQVTLDHLKRECIIPNYSDSESTIAHSEFIDATNEVVHDNFLGHRIYDPNIRISHIIKGRVPSALGKPVKELLQHE